MLLWKKTVSGPTNKAVIFKSTDSWICIFKLTMPHTSMTWMSLMLINVKLRVFGDYLETKSIINNNFSKNFCSNNQFSYF